MIYLDTERLRSAGFKVTSSGTGMTISGMTDISNKALNAAQEFADEIGLDEAETERMITNAVDASLWVKIRACSDRLYPAEPEAENLGKTEYTHSPKAKKAK